MFKRGVALSGLTVLNSDTSNGILKSANAIKLAKNKIGLQSLYADADQAIEKYKGADFDIAKEMAARKESNLLWVRARAIDADTVNANGDYFSKEELLKEHTIDGKKIPAYKTFEGCPIFSNHKNDDIDQARGMVIFAEWDEEDNCVYCTFFVDEDAYGDVARGIRQGYIHDVSMGCKVERGECSICGNTATNEKEYCDCLKKYKGRKYPGTNKQVFEYNFDIRFIELSVVNDGAFEACSIQELYDEDEILAKTAALNKSIEEVNAVLAKAGGNRRLVTANKTNSEYKQLVAQAASLVKVCQSAGTLIGGQIIPGNTINNASVNSVLRGLGIDSSSGLSVLDLLNLALNFLEVSVLNLFSRKDNIDLGHVGKITKSMADLQNTLQDMIDDGIDTGNQRQQAPLNQGNLQQPMAPQAPQQQMQQGMPTVDQSVQSYVPNGGVGKMTSPSPALQQPYAFNPSIGGGVSLASSLVWAGDNTKVVLASANVADSTSKFVNALDQFIKATNIKISRKEKSFEENKNITSPAVGGNLDMDHLRKIAQAQREKLAQKLTVDVKVEDTFGNEIVLSSKNGISAFRNGKLASWEPNLTESQISQIETGDVYRVASDLLQEFAQTREETLENHRAEFNHVKTVEEHLEGERKNVKGDVVLEEQIGKHRGPEPTDIVREFELAYGGQFSNDHATSDYIVHLLDNRELKDEDHLKTLEQLIHKYGLHKSAVSASQVVKATVNAMGRAVFAARVTPEEILQAAKNLSERKDLLSILTLACIHKGAIKTARKRNSYFAKFAQADFPVPTEEGPEEAVVNEMADAPEAMTPQDMVEALNVMVSNLEAALPKIQAVADSLKEQYSVEDIPGADEEEIGKKDEMETALLNDTPEDDDIPETDAIKASISAMAMASSERAIMPSDVVKAVNGMDTEELTNRVSKARTNKATTARRAERERADYFGLSQKTASNTEKTRAIIGWLADYADYYKVSTTHLVNACLKVAGQPLAAERIITAAIKAKKEAGVKLTENKINRTTIMCNISDIEGADVKSPDFDDKFKEFAISILSENGYHVDPGTFSLNHMDINENGDINATVETTINKTFAVEANMGGGSIEGTPETIVNVEGEGEVAPELVMSASVKSTRKAFRDSIIKQAQAVPGASGQAMGGADASGMGMGTPPMGAAAAGGGVGLSSLTGGDGLNQDATDSMQPTPEPGTKKPWGSICPQCGSTDVDIASGEGDCNSCHAHLKFRFSVDVVPSEEAKGGGEEAPAAPEVPGAEIAPGGEAAGAAFPAPAPGAGAPQVSGMPGQAANTLPVMIRVSYLADSDVYTKFASNTFDKEAALALPVGMICPSCGSRNPDNVNNKTYCTDCGTIAVTSRKASKNHPGKLISTITWIA